MRGESATMASEAHRRQFFTDGALLCVRSPSTGRVVLFDCGIRSAAESSARFLRIVARELSSRPDAPICVFADTEALHVRIANDVEVRFRPLTCSLDAAVAIVTHCLHAGVQNGN